MNHLTCFNSLSFQKLILINLIQSKILPILKINLLILLVQLTVKMTMLGPVHLGLVLFQMRAVLLTLICLKEIFRDLKVLIDILLNLFPPSYIDLILWQVILFLQQTICLLTIQMIFLIKIIKQPGKLKKKPNCRFKGRLISL